MKLYKMRVKIEKVSGIGIDQEKTIYAVADTGRSANDAMLALIPDADILETIHVSDDVIVDKGKA